MCFFYIFVLTCSYFYYFYYLHLFPFFIFIELLQFFIFIELLLCSFCVFSDLIVLNCFADLIIETNLEFKMSEAIRKNSSLLWRHFEKDAESGKARCNICREMISYKSTTANLRSHLKRKHMIIHMLSSADIC